MAKARREVEEKVRQVDIVFELLDARLPRSSQNPMVRSIINHKPRLVVFTKSDLADPKVTQQWIQDFKKKGLIAFAINVQSGTGVKQQILEAAEKNLDDLFSARERKGIRSRMIRAMVIGIPNVGKSSLINRLAGRSKTKTGNRPGVTKAQQWIRMKERMELLDTPGILWPKFEHPKVGFRLAASGAIKEELLPKEEVALDLIAFLLARYPDVLQQRYRIASQEMEAWDCFEQIAEKRGCLQKGGVNRFGKSGRDPVAGFSFRSIGQNLSRGTLGLEG